MSLPEPLVVEQRALEAHLLLFEVELGIEVEEEVEAAEMGLLLEQGFEQREKAMFAPVVVLVP